MIDLDAEWARAHTAHREGRMQEAESGYRRVLEANPRHADALHFLGLLLFQCGSRNAGVESVLRSLDVDADNPHAWNNLGNMRVVEDKPQEAIEAYCRATELDPTLVQAWYNLGIGYRRTKKIAEAVAAFCKAVELQPADTVVYERFGMLLYGLGRFKEAADVYRQWLQREPSNATARHMLAAMSGEGVPARADDAYLKTLFDRFSSSFDEQLATLGYRAPELLVSALLEHVPSDGRLELLDAGCGTGLCGVLVRTMTRRLVGVDISEGMVAKARERSIYDELVVGELCHFMRNRAESFDVVLSADTLVYFGELAEAFTAAKRCLRTGGVLAFTLENLEDGTGTPGYQLQPHGRYAHTITYVEGCLDAAGFAKVERRSVVLRKEKGDDVQGHLFVASA